MLNGVLVRVIEGGWGWRIGEIMWRVVNGRLVMDFFWCGALVGVW